MDAIGRLFLPQGEALSAMREKEAPPGRLVPFVVEPGHVGAERA